MKHRDEMDEVAKLINDRLESMKAWTKVVVTEEEYPEVEGEGREQLSFTVGIKCSFTPEVLDSNENLRGENSAAVVCNQLAGTANSLARVLMMLVEHKDAKAFKL